MNYAIIKKLRPLLKGAKLAYLFGSYVNGMDDEYSDLDLLIVKETNEDFFHRFKEFTALYNLDVPIDLLVYTPEEFAEMRQNKNPLILDIIENGVKII